MDFSLISQLPWWVCVSPSCHRRDATFINIGAEGGSGGSGGGECSQAEDFPEGETYLLPLGACVGEDKEAAEAGGYQLPLQCEVHAFGIFLLLSMYCPCPPPYIIFSRFSYPYICSFSAERTTWFGAAGGYGYNNGQRARLFVCLMFVSLCFFASPWLLHSVGLYYWCCIQNIFNMCSFLVRLPQLHGM